MNYRVCSVKDHRYPDGIAQCVFHGWTGGEKPKGICEYIDGSIRFVPANLITMKDFCCSFPTTDELYILDPVTNEVKFNERINKPYTILQETEED